MRNSSLTIYQHYAPELPKATPGTTNPLPVTPLKNGAQSSEESNPQDCPSSFRPWGGIHFSNTTKPGWHWCNQCKTCHLLSHPERRPGPSPKNQEVQSAGLSFNLPPPRGGIKGGAHTTSK